MSSELAQQILELQLTPTDHSRCAALSAKARDGRLTDDERRELEDYVNINDFLTILKSKAEASLRSNDPGA